MDDVRLRCFLSSSKRSLLEDTNAISIPEKNAEKSNDKRMKEKLSNFLTVIWLQRYNILPCYSLSIRKKPIRKE